MTETAEPQPIKSLPMVRIRERRPIPVYQLKKIHISFIQVVREETLKLLLARHMEAVLLKITTKVLPVMLLYVQSQFIAVDLKTENTLLFNVPKAIIFGGAFVGFFCCCWSVFVSFNKTGTVKEQDEELNIK